MPDTRHKIQKLTVQVKKTPTSTIPADSLCSTATRCMWSFRPEEQQVQTSSSHYHTVCLQSESDSLSFSIQAAPNDCKTVQLPGRLEWRLPGPLNSIHGSFNLLVAHKHHNVPGAQTKKRGHESKIRSIKENGVCFLLDHIFNLNASFDYINYIPLIKSCVSFFHQHCYSAVNGTVVLARRWVHVASFYHVNRWRYDGGAETCCKRRREVTRHVVCW